MVSLPFIDQISCLIDSDQEGGQVRVEANGVYCRPVKDLERGGIKRGTLSSSTIAGTALILSVNEFSPSGILLYFWGGGNSRPKIKHLLQCLSLVLLITSLVLEIHA